MNYQKGNFFPLCLPRNCRNQTCFLPALHVGVCFQTHPSCPAPPRDPDTLPVPSVHWRQPFATPEQALHVSVTPMWRNSLGSEMGRATLLTSQFPGTCFANSLSLDFLISKIRNKKSFIMGCFRRINWRLGK